MANSVVVISESGTLSVQAASVGASPEMEFRSGSFRGGVDERRVCGVFLFIPTGGKELEIRFEFTDQQFATTNLFGEPTQRSTDTVDPYREPRQTRDPAEGR